MSTEYTFLEYEQYEQGSPLPNLGNAQKNKCFFGEVLPYQKL